LFPARLTPVLQLAVKLRPSSAFASALNRERMGEGWDIVIHEDHESIYFMKPEPAGFRLG